VSIQGPGFEGHVGDYTAVMVLRVDHKKGGQQAVLWRKQDEPFFWAAG
jgi:hypothetical protein